MTNVDIPALKALAEAEVRYSRVVPKGRRPTLTAAFRDAANPTTVLALIARIEELEMQLGYAPRGYRHD